MGIFLMIKIDNLSLDFDGKVIFKNAQFEIPDNKVTVISGPNGSGKTTLLKIITGSIKPQECSIENTFREFFSSPKKLSTRQELLFLTMCLLLFLKILLNGS